jgi:hypothetical protein
VAVEGSIAARVFGFLRQPRENRMDFDASRYFTGIAARGKFYPNRREQTPGFLHLNPASGRRSIQDEKMAGKPTMTILSSNSSINSCNCCPENYRVAA